MEFLTQADLDSMNAEKINSILNTVVKLAVEEALQALPFVIGNVMNQTSTLKELATEFYKNNKDLQDHKDIVARLIEQEEHNNPGAKFEDILDSVAPKARKIISSLRNTDKERHTVEKVDSLAQGIL